MSPCVYLVQHGSLSPKTAPSVRYLFVFLLGCLYIVQLPIVLKIFYPSHYLSTIDPHDKVYPTSPFRGDPPSDYLTLHLPTLSLLSVPRSLYILLLVYDFTRW